MSPAYYGLREVAELLTAYRLEALYPATAVRFGARIDQGVQLCIRQPCLSAEDEAIEYHPGFPGSDRECDRPGELGGIYSKGHRRFHTPGEGIIRGG